MKPPPFVYRAPETLEEALELLSEHGSEARPLAGGQSLLPLLNFRLTRPAVLIDLNRIAGLAGVVTRGDGGISLGAMTRQRAAERSGIVAERAPLLHEALPFVAHPQIRNRGTLGGSLAHADPAAELPAVAVALNARLQLRARSHKRAISVDDFFTGLFSTALRTDELLVGIDVPPLPPSAGWAFEEVARRRGDFALLAVAAVVELNHVGACRAARIVCVSAGPAPVRASGAEACLLGSRPDAAVVHAAAEAVAAHDIRPVDDVHASATYRRHLARVLTRRALSRAFERAARPFAHASPLPELPP